MKKVRIPEKSGSPLWSKAGGAGGGGEELVTEGTASLKGTQKGSLISRMYPARRSFRKPNSSWILPIPLGIGRLVGLAYQIAPSDADIEAHAKNRAA